MKYPAPAEVEDKHEFYPARVDDRPASIALNLAYRDLAPIPGATQVYCAFIEIREHGDHGMGSSAEESHQLNQLEDQINELATHLGLYPIGRLRNGGVWQPCYMGPPGIDFEASVGDLVLKNTAHKVSFGGKHDPEWTYYNDFLYPGPERWQWIMDRRTVEVFSSKGDPLKTERRVDHWAFFATEAGRGSFVQAAGELGFKLEKEWKAEDAVGGRPWVVQVYRDDRIELDHIHAVVMELTQIAEAEGGDYDGWEAPVLKVESPETKPAE